MIHCICVGTVDSTSAAPHAKDGILVLSWQDGADGGIAKCGTCDSVWRFRTTDAEEHDPWATEYWWTRVEGDATTALVQTAERLGILDLPPERPFARDGDPRVLDEDGDLIRDLFRRVREEPPAVHRIVVMDAWTLRLIYVRPSASGPEPRAMDH